MALVGNTNEEKIWNYLKAQGFTDAGTAGLMGNLYAESGLRPNNLQNSYEGKLGMADAEYTEMVDKGTYTNFGNDRAGYGIAQWTHPNRKTKLLAYAKKMGKSIGDLDMQLGFLMEELSTSYKAVLNVLKTATSVRAASDAVLLKFEIPADRSEQRQKDRAEYGQKYFDKYAGGDSSAVGKGDVSMTVQALRQKVVSIAQGWIGRKESNGSHREIIDLYNSHKPLARGYPVKYTDAWCSTFASAVAIKAGLTDIIPTECGCGKHIELFKKLGSWEENDAYVPKPADYIFYDWQDGPDYATTDNQGGADHVGIVEKVVGQTITVIEGNMNNAVGRRTLKVNGRYIRGYGVPKYSSKVTAGSGAPGNTATPAEKPTTDSFAVGNTVDFIGTTHYSSSNSTQPVACKPGRAKVTAISRGAKHPYHLVRVSGGASTVYGWVDVADIAGESGVADKPTYTVATGDSLWGIAQKRLGNGNRYKEIMALNGLTSTTIRPGQKLRMPS